MLDLSALHRVRSIGRRAILNSHLALTSEFTVELEDGTLGIGSSPQGETISVYEDRSTRLDTQAIVDAILHERLLEGPLRQADFDQFLLQRVGTFGRNNCWALSLAFFSATHAPLSRFWLGRGLAGRPFPRLCLNVLNGGRHAYTNPVLSDFAEYLVVPRFDDIGRVVHDHADIQRVVKDWLDACPRVLVNGNPVRQFPTRDNRECVAFLMRVLDHLGLRDAYQVMIDASAGDLWNGDGYGFAITDQSVRSTAELRGYWEDLIDEFGLGLLEDPFREHDLKGWKGLAGGPSSCLIIGDNLYSSDPGRMEQGARDGLTHGVIIKPNQAGTVTSVIKAVEVARTSGQTAITSHRSIATESDLLPLVTVMEGVEYVKIGPLQTDYSSVLRLNELIRLTGARLD